MHSRAYMDIIQSNGSNQFSNFAENIGKIVCLYITRGARCKIVARVAEHKNNNNIHIN